MKFSIKDFFSKCDQIRSFLIWGIYRIEKFEQIMEEIFPPENIENLEVNKVKH